MAKPIIHAQSSAKKYGGKAEDYLKIHEIMDSSKEAFADNRHRAATHNTWFIHRILPLIFGSTFINSDGKTVSVADIGHQHVIEDYRMRFIPTLQDYLEHIPVNENTLWVNNGLGKPPTSARELLKVKERKENDNGICRRTEEYID